MKRGGPIALCLLFAACGGGAHFDAQSFVEEANLHGAGLVLGPTLQSTREDAELQSVSFEGSPAGGAGGRARDAHGGGTLAVLEDEDEALAEYRRCESAASLICFRAANVALYFQGAIQPVDLERLEAALGSMAE